MHRLHTTIENFTDDGRQIIRRKLMLEILLLLVLQNNSHTKSELNLSPLYIWLQPVSRQNPDGQPHSLESCRNHLRLWGKALDCPWANPRALCTARSCSLGTSDERRDIAPARVQESRPIGSKESNRETQLSKNYTVVVIKHAVDPRLPWESSARVVLNNVIT